MVKVIFFFFFDPSHPYFKTNLVYFKFMGSIITDFRQMEQSEEKRGSKCIMYKVVLVSKYKIFFFNLNSKLLSRHIVDTIVICILKFHLENIVCD